MTHKRREDDCEFPQIIDEKWHLIQCCGCNSIKVLKIEDSPDYKTPEETHYPPHKIRQSPSWAIQLPDQFQYLIKEIYNSLYIKCFRLSAMGARTLIDLMLFDMLGDVGGFQEKLKTAVKNSLLTKDQKATITAAVEAGHAASHRGFRPTEEQITDVLDIVESALNQQYVLQGASRRLNDVVPKRGNR